MLSFFRVLVLLLLVVLSRPFLFAQSGPLITALTPAGGPVGTSVTISGSGFGATQGSSTLTFNGVAATPTNWSGASITVPVPSGAATGNVVVTVNSLASNAVWFTVPGTLAYGYSYQRAITISHAKVPNTDQTNFPLLFSGTYSYLATTSNGGNVTSANGYDIIFTSDSAGQNKLSFEQVGYNPSTGAVNYWVQIPALSHSQDTLIYVFYGNSAITASQATPTATWDVNYKAVWHMNEGTGSTAHGSTVNSNNGSWAGNTPYYTTGNLQTYAGSFNGSDYVKVATPTGLPTGNSPRTYTAWFKLNGTQNGWLFSYGPLNNGQQWGLFWNSGHLKMNFWNDDDNVAVNVSVGTWYHVAFAYDGTTGRLFLNGSLVGSYSPSTPNTVSAPFYLGQRSDNNEFLMGAQDEARISSIARSSDWIATEYNNQSNPAGFYGVGAANAPIISSLSPSSGSGGTTVTIAGSLFGSTQGSGSVTFNGTTATPTSWSDTSITVPVPAGATTGNVVVTVNGATSNGMLFTVPPPSITSLTPGLGSVSTPVTIAGIYFGSTQGNSTVTFNGVAATPTNWSDTSITVPVPAGAVTGNVVVTVSGVASNPVWFSVPGTLAYGYGYQRAITISHTKVPNTDQTNFPLLFSGTYAYLATTSNGGNVTSPNGYDIIFTSDPGGQNILKFEPMAYNPATGAINDWVRIPTLSHSQDTVIYMFYGNASIAASPANPAGTWDANYKAVWHLSEGTGATAYDSTVNANGGSWAGNGSNHYTTGNVETYAGSFDGSTNRVIVPNSNSLDISGANSAVTLEAWVYLTAGTNGSVIRKGYEGASASEWGLGVATVGSNYYPSFRTVAAMGRSQYASSAPLALHTWYHVVATAVYGATNAAIYVNGTPQTLTVSDGSASTYNFPSTTNPLDLGASSNATGYFPGNIGDARVSSIARSGDWIATQYNNQSNPSAFYSLGAANAPVLYSLSPNLGSAGTTVTIAGSRFGATQGSSTVTFNGTAATPSSWSDGSITVPVPAGATTGNVVVTVNGEASTGMPFTVPPPSITGLTPGFGPVGTSVTIAGIYFGSAQGSSTVTFNGVASTPTIWSDGSITVPAGAATGNVVVTVNNVASNPAWFTVPGVLAYGYGYRQTLTISHTKVPNTDQSNFPFLFSGTYSYLANTSSGGNVTSPNGYDIVFTADAAGTTPLPFEQESYNATTGAVNYWVNVPVLSHTTDTAIYMFYGNAAVTTDQSNKPGVWSNSYVGVWHLPNGTTLSPADSSSNANNLTNNASVAAGAGVIDGAASFNGSGAYLSHSNTGQFDSNAWTWDGWVEPTWVSGAPSANPCIFGLRDTSGTRLSLHLASNYSSIMSWTGSLTSWTPPIAQNQWYHLAFAYNSGTVSLYINGSLVSTQNQTQGSATGRQFDIGFSTSSPEYWKGLIDEARFSSVVRSADWIATEYNNQSNPTGFYSVVGAVPPSVTSLSPATAPVGASITIAGSNFGATQMGSTVTFNGVAASPTAWSGASITVPVPAGAATGIVVVTVNSMTSSGVNFTVLPNITGLTPNSGSAGTGVTIAGTSFAATQGASMVTFNGTLATPTSWSDTRIGVPVPNGATSGNVVVTTASGPSSGVNFTVPPPSISSLSPTTGNIATAVTISGQAFGATQGSSTVSFNGTAASPTVWSNTSIEVPVPPGATTGNVLVTVAGTASNGTVFTVAFASGQTVLSDSMNRTTTYAFENIGGRNFMTAIAGSGCASCGGRGNSAFTVDTLGNTLSSTDALNNTTSFTYDSMGNVLTKTQNLNPNTPLTWSYTYNAFQEVLTATDPLGNVTTNVYDPNGNLLSTTTPPPSGSGQGLATGFQYNGLGELTQVTDPKGNSTTLTYTQPGGAAPAGLVASITDAQNNATTFTYDGRGNRLTSTDALNNTTTYTYDAMNRLTKITAPDLSTTQFGYDYRGRRISVTDANGKVTAYQYDDADRLVAVTDAAQNVTVYGYDTENNLVTITDAASHETQFAYDALGRVTQVTFPSSLSEGYSYDAMNNLLSKTDRKGQTINYGYDPLYRLTSKTYPDSTAVNYSYDLLSRLTQVTDPSGTYTFAYDNLGRLVGTGTQYSFLSTPLDNAYSYDAASNRISFSNPQSQVTIYNYDSLNRLTSLTDPNTGGFGFGYDALGRRTSLMRPNGVNTSYSYDALSRLLGVLHGGGALPGSTSYAYDAAGNRTSKTAVQAGDPNPVSVLSQYSYDNIYELTQAVVNGTVAETYSYDAVGNRLTSAGPTSYNYNSSNELTSDSNATFAYDNNGNTLSKTDSTGTTNYTWDFENRLTQVTLPGQGGTVYFNYDPFGRRIRKASSSGTTIYAYEGDNITEELGGGGSLLAHYTQGEEIDEPLATTGAGGTYFFHTDGLGSVTALTDGAAQIAATYVYDSFGNVTASAGTLTNPFQYTAREFDSETGLYYYRARYFDPQIGRFVSEDPIRFAGGENFYAYLDNEPTLFDDPLGLLKCIGTARVIGGNRRFIGTPGAFNGWPSDLAKYGVTRDSVAVIPSQFGQTKASMRGHLDEVWGSVSGTRLTRRRDRKGKIHTVEAPYQFDFADVRDVVDDRDTRLKNGLNSIDEYQQWLIDREASQNGGVGPLILEFPGLGFGTVGMSSVVIDIPDGWTCPCGTSPSK